MRDNLIQRLGGRCVRCRWHEQPRVLEIHHRLGRRSRGRRSWGQFLKAVSKTLAQWELVCPNCAAVERQHHRPQVAAAPYLWDARHMPQSVTKGGQAWLDRMVGVERWVWAADGRVYRYAAGDGGGVGYDEWTKQHPQAEGGDREAAKRQIKQSGGAHNEAQ